MPLLAKKKIRDRSKADKFAKLVTCGQISWLVLQCFGRIVQGLPDTTLEDATIGFANLSLTTFLLWFPKPADIEVSMLLQQVETTASTLERTSPLVYNCRQTLLDFIDTVKSPSFTSEIILEAPAWPCRSSFVGPSTRIRNDVCGLKYSKLDQLYMFLVWVGYAGIHLAAWNFSFPDHTELVLWRAASTTIVGSMLTFWITSYQNSNLMVAFLWPKKRKVMEKNSDDRWKVFPIQILLGAMSTFLYVAARILLILRVLVCFRRLPVRAYEAMN